MIDSLWAQLKIRKRLFNAKEERLRAPEILWNFRAAH